MAHRLSCNIYERALRCPLFCFVITHNLYITDSFLGLVCSKRGKEERKMAEKKGCKGYAGRIGNKSSQKVSAVFPQSGSIGGKVRSGDDLRVKSGK